MTHETLILRDACSMRLWAQEQRRLGLSIGLVPTMGALHEGHLSLAAEARKHCDKVVVSIFVNPTQFDRADDLKHYPRNLEGDAQLLAPHRVDVIFAPTPESIYPSEFATYIVPEKLSDHLCGATRPGHFRGVCTVVLMLFRMTLCHRAYFGEKDYQQLQIIRRMNQDLWLDVEVVGMPIVREADGVAKSSRNLLLSPSERAQAVVLSQSIKHVQALYQQGERRVAILQQAASEQIQKATSARIDYLSFVDASTLAPVDVLSGPSVLAMAVFIGRTRLIDNCQLG